MATEAIRTDTVERFLGDKTKASAFLLRFDGRSRKLKHKAIFDGTLRNWTQADIDLFPDGTTPRHGKTKAQAEAEKAAYADLSDAAYQFVIDSLDDAHATIIDDYVDGRDGAAAYAQMMKLFRDTSGVTTMTMIWELLHTRATDQAEAPATLRKQVELGNKLKQAKCELPDEFMKAMALFSLPPELDHIRHKYLGMTDSAGKTQTYKALREHLEMEFTAATADVGVTTAAHRLAEATKANADMQTRIRELEQSVLALRDQPAGGQEQQQKQHRVCAHCGKKYHTADDCWSLHPEKRPDRIKKQGREQANTVMQVHVMQSSCMTVQKCWEMVCLTVTGSTGKVVDSGCGISTLTSAAGCTNVRPAMNRWVEDASLHRHRVTQLVDWTFEVQKDRDKGAHSITLRDCLVVPTLGIELISTDHLNNMQYKVVLGPGNGGKYIVTPDGDSIPLEKHGSLPFLPINPHSTYSVCGSASCVAHGKLMHAGQRQPDLTGIVDDAVVVTDKYFCHACAACKQQNVKHARVEEEQSTVPGDLIWSDVAGPLPPSLYHSNRYAVLFMDDCTEVRFLYFVKRKANVAEAFKMFCADFKRWGTVNRIRTDNGGEYTAGKFAAVCADEVIAHEWSSPRTPQQMGKAERSWRALKEMARTGLMYGELGESAWERAMATAAHIRNRLPTTRHPDTTPIQRLTGKRATHKHLHVFGAVAYPLNKDHKRAMEPRAEAGIFMGYVPEGYVIWVPKRRRFLRTDAVLVDDATYTREGRNQKFKQFHYQLPKPKLNQLLNKRSWNLQEISAIFPDAVTDRNDGLAGVRNNQYGIYDEDGAGGLETPPPRTPEPAAEAEFETPFAQRANGAGGHPDLDEADDADPPDVEPGRPDARARQNNVVGLRERRALAESGWMSEGFMDEVRARGQQGGLRSGLQHTVDDGAVTDEANAVVPTQEEALSELHHVIDEVMAIQQIAGGAPGDTATSSPMLADALQGPEKQQYWESMVKEHRQCYPGPEDPDRVWDLVTRTNMEAEGAKALPSGWRLVKKSVDTGDGRTTHDKHKGRITAGGHRQKHGRDYDETWAPVVSFSILRLLIAFAVTHGYDITQMDFSGAFLNALLPEHLQVYMEQPWGFKQYGPNGEEMVCKLRRALYGLKQSGRLWYQTLKTYMQSQGFQPMDSEQCVFIRHDGSKWQVVILYVDDLLTFSNDANMKAEFTEALCKKFKVEDKGKLQYYLGINIQSHGHTCTMDQRKYVSELLDEFGMNDEHSVTTPVAKAQSEDTRLLTEEQAATFRRMVGCLVYVAIMTRPDIAFAVSLCSRQLHKPAIKDKVAVERVYRYLKDTMEYKLVYNSPNSTITLHVDSDLAGCKVTARSQTGLVLMMFGAVVAWRSARQLLVALSTSEAEFMGMCDGAKELVYHTQFLEETGIPELQQPGISYAEATMRSAQDSMEVVITTQDVLALTGEHVTEKVQQSKPRRWSCADRTWAVMHGDNEGALKMAHEGADNARTKHMHRRYHFIRELVNCGWLKMKHVRSQLNIADGLTKGLPKAAMRTCARRMGLHPIRR